MAIKLNYEAGQGLSSSILFSLDGSTWPLIVIDKAPVDLVSKNLDEALNVPERYLPMHESNSSRSLGVDSKDLADKLSIARNLYPNPIAVAHIASFHDLKL